MLQEVICANRIMKVIHPEEDSISDLEQYFCAWACERLVDRTEEDSFLASYSYLNY